MKIALLMPITLTELQPLFKGKEMPYGYPYPLFVPLVYEYIQRGHEIVLCTIDKRSRKSSILIGDKITLFAAGTLPKAKLRAIVNFEYEIRQMVSFLKKNPCDIYHAHWEYDFAQAALRVSQNRSIITIHDWPNEVNKYHKDFYWNRRCELGCKTLRQGKYFSTVSPYMAANMEQFFPEKEVKIIPNFIEDVKNEYTKTLKIKLVAINRGYDELKNVNTLMEAFAILRKKIQDCCILRLIGSGYEKNGPAEVWAKEHNIADGINFIGMLPHTKAMKELGEASIFVHASREESFGMVLLEAMLCKVPIVAGKNSGAVPWILEEGKSGELVDIEKPQQIADAILKLIKNKAYCNSLIENARSRVDDFSVDKVCTQYLNYYVEVIRREQI